MTTQQYKTETIIFNEKCLKPKVSTNTYYFTRCAQLWTFTVWASDYIKIMAIHSSDILPEHHINVLR